VRRLRRLVQKRSLRWSEGVCVLEGPDLVASALAADIEFEGIYVDQTPSSRHGTNELYEIAARHGVRVYSLAPGVLEKIADATTPQPVLAAVRLPVVEIDTIAAEGLILVLHDVRDPGNAGTLIRSADAAGATAVIFTGHSVDPFNPKTLRATAGSIFHLPVAVGELASTLGSFAARGARSYATVVHGGADHRDLDYSRATLIVIGNEAEGLDDESVALCDGAISISMAGSSESLNAGVAGSLIAFEAMWRRQGTKPEPLPPSL
jgi:RNA methyltransferase, TrmH family